MSPSNLQVELQQLRSVIEEVTGLSSRWNGIVTVMSAEEIVFLKGKTVFAEKQWGCSILVTTPQA